MRHIKAMLLGAALMAGTTTLAVAQSVVPVQWGWGHRDNDDRQAYREGFRQGQEDARHNRRFDPETSRWRERDDRQAYRSGYERGFQQYHGSRRVNYRARLLGVATSGVQLLLGCNCAQPLVDESHRNRMDSRCQQRGVATRVESRTAVAPAQCLRQADDYLDRTALTDDLDKLVEIMLSPLVPFQHRYRKRERGFGVACCHTDAGCADVDGNSYTCPDRDDHAPPVTRCPTR